MSNLPESRTITYLLHYYKNDGTRVPFDTTSGTDNIYARLNIVNIELNFLGSGYRTYGETWLRTTPTNLKTAHIRLIHQIQLPANAQQSNGIINPSASFVNIEDNSNFLVIDMIQTVLDYYDTSIDPEVKQFALTVPDRV